MRREIYFGTGQDRKITALGVGPVSDAQMRPIEKITETFEKMSEGLENSWVRPPKYRQKIFDLKHSRIYVRGFPSDETCCDFSFREFDKPGVNEELENFIGENYMCRSFNVIFQKIN